MSLTRTFSGWLHADRPNGNATPDPESPDLEARRRQQDSHRIPIPSVLQAPVNARELEPPILSQQPWSEPIVPGSLTSEHHPIAQKPMPLVQISAPSVQTPIPWNVDNQRHHIHPNGSVYWTCTVLGIQLVHDVKPLVPDQGVLEALENIRIRNDSTDWCIYTGEEDWRYVHHKYELASNTLESILQIRNPGQSTTNSDGLLLQARYWSFVQSHPSFQVGRINVKKVLQRTKEALVWCHADRVLFGTSNAPFSRADAREMTELIKTVAELDGPTLKIWYCAAILRTIAEERRASHYGQADAREVRRVEREDDIDWDYPLKHPWDWVVWHLVIFFSLGSAATYQKRINNVDRIDSKFSPGGINTLRWRALLKALCKEWADINLLATVLVSSAVALLSIPSNSRFVLIAVLISALCGISSVLSGMFLISTHQARTETFGSTAILYFRRIKSRGTNTSRPLAVILGLPLSLMLWGMIWLISAIIGFAYNTGLDQHSAVTRFLPLAVTGMFVMLGIAIVYMLYGVWRPEIIALLEHRLGSAQPDRVPTNTGAARFGNPIVRPSGNQRTGAESA